MDVYQADSGGYESGNMRKSEAENKFRSVADYNRNQIQSNINAKKVLAGKILSDQTSASTSIIEKSAAQGIATGNLIGTLPARVEKYQKWALSKANGASSDVQATLKKASADPLREPTANMSFEEKQAYHNPLAKPPPRPTNAPPEPAPTEPRAEGTPASSSGTMSDSHAVTSGEKAGSGAGDVFVVGKGETSLLSKGGKLAGRAAEGLSTATDIAQGGMDLYADIKKGGIAGNNGFEKAGNILQIGSGIADTIGLVFPPAEIIGGLFGALGGVLTGAGDAEEGIDSDKKVADADTKAADIKPVQLMSAAAPISSGVVATARDA